MKKVAVSLDERMVDLDALVDLFEGTVFLKAETPKNVAEQYTGEHTGVAVLGS